MSTTRSRQFRVAVFAAVSAVVFAAGIGAVKYTPYVSAAQQASTELPTPRLPEVDVIRLQPQQMRLWSEFSGRLSPVNHVDVRP